MKILHITNTPPIPSWGGAMTFYRHFCESGDFDIQAITDNIDILNYNVPYPYLLVNHGKLFQRVSKTRFYKVPHTYSNLIGARVLHVEMLRAAEAYNPDAIFTVAGSWSWMAILARKIAKKLNKPLIGSFNDWWNYNIIYHPFAEKRLEKRFREFYQSCDLALCTSKGMYKALGTHRNYLISYPTGAKMDVDDTSWGITENKPKRTTLAYSGNLGDWYGRMLEQVIFHTNFEQYNFKIFGSNPSWSLKCDALVKEKGFYKGQVPFKQLQAEMKQVDGLLLLMGFNEEIAQIERTSFKTKFLDYLTFQKPIFLWGPEYCSAFTISEEFDSTARTSGQDVTEYIMLFNEVFNDTERINELLHNSRMMYENRFNPELIHQKLLQKIKELV